MALHPKLPFGEIHIAHAFEFANAAARTGATGLLPTDVGKIARQLDNDTFFILKDDSPVTWIAIGAGSGVVSIDDLSDVDTTTSPPSVGEQLEFDGTNWVPAAANSPHAATHILAGTDEVDGDQLGINFTPSFYIPSVAPVEATDLDHLTAHLSGIDSGLGPRWVEDEFTPTSGQVTFILSQTPVDTDSLALTVNGVTTDDVSDFTISGITITWLNNLFVLDPSDKLLIKYF